MSENNREGEILQRIIEIKKLRSKTLVKLDEDFVKVAFFEGDTHRILNMLKGAKINLKDTLESLKAYNDSLMDMEKKLVTIRRRARGRTYRLDPILGVVEDAIEPSQTSAKRREDYKFFTSCSPDENETQEQQEESESESFSRDQEEEQKSSTVPPNSPVDIKMVLDKEVTPVNLFGQGKPKISRARKLGYCSESSIDMNELASKGDQEPLHGKVITTVAEVHQEDTRENGLEEPSIKQMHYEEENKVEVLKLDSQPTYNLEKPIAEDEEDESEETTHVPMSPRSTLYTPQEQPPLTLNGENITTEEIFGRPITQKREHHKRKMQKIPPLALKASDEGSDAQVDNPENSSSEEELTSEISFSGDSFASDVLSELTSKEEWPNLVTPSANASDFSSPKQSKTSRSWLRSGAMDICDKYSPYLKTNSTLRPKQWFTNIVQKIFPKKTPTVVPAKIEIETLASSPTQFKRQKEQREQQRKRFYGSIKPKKTSGQVNTPRYPTFISSDVLTSQHVKSNKEYEGPQFYIKTPSTTTGATPKRYPTFITSKFFKKTSSVQNLNDDHGSVLWIKKPEKGVWFQDSDSMSETPPPPPRSQRKFLQRRASKKRRNSKNDTSASQNKKMGVKETFV